MSISSSAIRELLRQMSVNIQRTDTVR